jgi:ABC-type branched-subunit amino acid transport system substrate-binding protein
LLIPVSGSAGLWGPSAIACAELAAEEVNQSARLPAPISLTVINASDEAATQTMADELRALGPEMDAFVGMHTSSVREVIKRVIDPRAPFVYTPLYEGGEHREQIYTIGEQPQQQLRPAIHAMVERYRCHRWIFVGNDYVWPRISHALARRYVGEAGATLLADHYLPLGTLDFDGLLDGFERLKPDGLLLSLIGQDAIDFNRQFGARKLHRTTLRLSCAVEENGLLAIGAKNTEGLHAAAGYFSALNTDANLDFIERYQRRFGERAPALNSLGQSTYEGVMFAAALLQTRQSRASTAPPIPGLNRPIRWHGVREAAYLHNDACVQSIYLAQAQGLGFEILERL